MSFPDIPQQPVERINTDLDLTITDEDLAWDQGGSVMDHPDELDIFTLNENEAEQRWDAFIRLPEGYDEPMHTHPGAHATLVLEGSIHCRNGTVLRPGDYIYGQKEPHGMTFPEGCTVFISFVGGSPFHEWVKDERPSFIE